MSMLQPPIAKLLKEIPNRYLIVNMAAQRARAIAQVAEDGNFSLPEKPVSTALREIANGEVELVPADEIEAAAPAEPVKKEEEPIDFFEDDDETIEEE